MSQFLIGNKVYLRPCTKEDLFIFQKWSNDSDIRRLTGEVTPMTSQNVEAYYEKISNDDSRIWFSIVLKDTDKVIEKLACLGCFIIGVQPI